MKKLGYVDICGIDYEVQERTVQEDNNLADAYGYTVHSKCLMILEEGLQPLCFRNTLLHEIQHGIWEHSGCRGALEDEETFIQIYTPHLIRAMQSMKKWKV